VVGVQFGWLGLAAGAAVARVVWAQAGLWQLLTSAWVYGLVAGISYLIRTQRRLREREVAAARAEALAAEAQLQAVRAQLNPHFFYNALHALSTLIRHDPARAEAALDRLGELLRYALDRDGDEPVHLNQEWTFASTYLELERLRLGDRLRLDAQLDDAALECLVPPFVIQPLVENAVRHGIAGRPEGGTLRVRAAARDDRLTLEVSDDGPGADPAEVEAAPGLGLRSLRRRLAAAYRGSERLAVDTAVGRGFRVTVTLPAQHG